MEKLRQRSTRQQRSTYHHGDLPAALIDAALAQIAESGVHGFSVAEAARSTGVSISAPYRHFADRDELLAACAVAACKELQHRFERALVAREAPADQLAAAAGAYVRFAAEREAMFAVLYGAGLDKASYPLLSAAAADLLDTVAAPARKLAPNDDEEAAANLVQALNSLAQGYALLLLEGNFGDPPAAVDLAVERVMAATAALLRGRALLFD